MAAAVIAVFGAGAARADDPAPDDLVAGGGVGGLVESEDASFLSGLARYLSDVQLSVGAQPVDAPLATPGDGAPAGYDTFAELTLHGLTIAGRYGIRDDRDGIGGSAATYGIGAAYNLDSWTVGLDWSRGERAGLLDTSVEAGEDVLSLSTFYRLRPDFRIAGVVELNEPEVADPAASGNLAIGIGTLINF